MKDIPVRHINIPSDDLKQTENFKIRSLLEICANTDMVQDVHRHEFYYILAVKEGKGKHIIDFTPYNVEDYTVFIMRPGQVHQVKISSGSTGYLMQFNADYFRPEEKYSVQLLSRHTQNNICYLTAPTFKQLDKILSYIFKEYSLKQEGYEEVIKANLNIFFIELVRHSKDKTSSNEISNSYYSKKLEYLLNLIEVNFHQHKQVTYYAELMHLSTYQLNEIVKRCLGKTCSELINEYIILESKRYLLATSNQINNIAYNLGYEDVSYFIRFFKRQTGFTPEAFRKNKDKSY